MLYALMIINMYPQAFPTINVECLEFCKMNCLKILISISAIKGLLEQRGRTIA